MARRHCCGEGKINDNHENGGMQMKKIIIFAAILVIITSSQCMGEAPANDVTGGNNAAYTGENNPIPEVADVEVASDRNGHLVAAGITGLSASTAATGLFVVGGGVVAGTAVVIATPLAVAAAIGGLAYWLFSD
jgi:hypothetical protein